MRNFSRGTVGTAFGVGLLAVAIWGGSKVIGGDDLCAMMEVTHEGQVADHGMFTPDDVTWKAGPDSLPAGLQMAVLEGDPTQSGPFTMRLKAPDGCKIAPHTHPAIEHVTVISGTLFFGTGETFDEKKMKELPAGSFAFMKPGMTHYAKCKGETILQVHGDGPWGIKYVNAADDPRKSKTATEGR